MMVFLRKRFQKNGIIRHVVVHNHLFKNAGTTIDWTLRKNFGARFVDHRDNAAMKGGPGYLETFFREHPHVCALSSHHLPLPLPQMVDTVFHLLMMYRHPLERVASAYHFERIQTQDTLGARFARKHSLREYVIWRMRTDVPPTIRNFHVWCSLPSPRPWSRGVTREDLERAKEFAMNLSLLGIVEEFDASMILFETVLRPAFPTLDLSYVQQNVRQNRCIDTQERIACLRNEIGEDTYAMLLEGNSFDIELYEYALEIFKKRTGEMHDFGEKFAAFKSRLKM